MYLRMRHLSGKSRYLTFSELMTSFSVPLSGSCTVHVSGTGPDVYPLTSLQSVFWFAISSTTRCLFVDGILATDMPISKTTQNVTELWNEALNKLFPPCSVSDNIVSVSVEIYAAITNIKTSTRTRTRTPTMCIRNKELTWMQQWIHLAAACNL